MVRPLRGMKLTGMSEKDYADVVSSLRKAYQALRLSESGATIVINAKALCHLLPDLIPPIDRQYTVRFFRHAPDKWLTAKRKFKTVNLPKGAEAQFRLFQEICGKVKHLADPNFPRPFFAPWSPAAIDRQPVGTCLTSRPPVLSPTAHDCRANPGKPAGERRRSSVGHIVEGMMADGPPRYSARSAAR
jgi:hypothetical protein